VETFKVMMTDYKEIFGVAEEFEDEMEVAAP
jgi:hypothetical protein